MLSVSYGLFTSIIQSFQAAHVLIFHIHSGFRCRLDQLQHTAYPDYAFLGLGMVLSKYCNFDIFEIVLWIFLTTGILQVTDHARFHTLLLYSAVLYSMGISPGCCYGAVTTPDLPCRYSENINMVAQGLLLRISRRGDGVYGGLLPYGGMGQRLLNVLMCFKIKAAAAENTGKNLHRTGYFHINEPTAWLVRLLSSIRC